LPRPRLRARPGGEGAAGRHHRQPGQARRRAVDGHLRGRGAERLLGRNKNSLCASCHKDVDAKAHSAKSVGFAHEQINCIGCQTTKTRQTGAGLGKGLDGKDGKNCWMNDITSHLFDVPRKTNVAVKGAAPGSAMPIPYTNACGARHQADTL
jgi:hypothetical protein